MGGSADCAAYGIEITNEIVKALYRMYELEGYGTTPGNYTVDCDHFMAAFLEREFDFILDEFNLYSRTYYSHSGGEPELIAYYDDLIMWDERDKLRSEQYVDEDDDTNTDEEDVDIKYLRGHEINNSNIHRLINVDKANKSFTKLFDYLNISYIKQEVHHAEHDDL
jgi:hypothetical protein